MRKKEANGDIDDNNGSDDARTQYKAEDRHDVCHNDGDEWEDHKTWDHDDKDNYFGYFNGDCIENPFVTSVSASEIENSDTDDEIDSYYRDVRNDDKPLQGD